MDLVALTASLIMLIEGIEYFRRRAICEDPQEWGNCISTAWCIGKLIIALMLLLKVAL